jgi:hypothetical protein
MKKLRLLLPLVALLLLVGCSTEQERLDYIYNTYHTRDVYVHDGQSTHYIFRLSDGSVWIMMRSDSEKPEKLFRRQIFAPTQQ